jgi:hypothetical protein
MKESLADELEERSIDRRCCHHSYDLRRKRQKVGVKILEDVLQQFVRKTQHGTWRLFDGSTRLMKGLLEVHVEVRIHTWTAWTAWTEIR